VVSPRSDISVVICTYSSARWPELTAAIDSLRAQLLQPLETIVVVDHNSELFERARSLQDVDVVVVENDGVRGLSAARNTGVSWSLGTYVAFLDDDAVAKPDWLQRIARAYCLPDVAAVGGPVEPAWADGRPAWFPPEFDWVVGCSYPGLPEAPGATRNLIGANMSFRRSVLDSIGGFRPDIGRLGTQPLGGEETELCIRAGSVNGSVVLYDPSVRVRHVVDPSRASWGYFLRRCWAEGLSKEHVSRVVGTDAGLASERSYVGKVLPRGFARGVRDAVHGDLAGAGRALAIAAGLGATTAGFVAGYRRAKTSALVAPYLAAIAVALTLWAAALPSVDLRAMTDLGLLSVLPPLYFVAVALLTVSFVLALRNPRVPSVLYPLHVVLYVLFIHATPSIVYGTLRYAWAWKHVGIVDYIQRHGSVDPHISFLTAYHNWPGFFAVVAMFTKAAGLHDAVSVARWAPPFFELLFLVPLVVVLRALTRNDRRVWLAVWLFYSANWIGQDYFSPQAFTYFLYLSLLAICLVWFRPQQLPVVGGRIGRLLRSGDPDAPAVAPSTPLERLGLVAIAVLVCATVVVTHQLTPAMAIVALTLLVLARRCTLRTLPLLLAVLMTAWVTFFAVGFLDGNLYWIVDSIGSLGQNASSTLVNLGRESAGQRLVGYIDRSASALIWGLALLGFTRRARRGRIDLTPALLAFAPFLMLWGNAYGGEMLFRVYFFSLPFMALLAAALVFPQPAAGAVARFHKVGLSLAVSAMLFTGLLFGYYGKERQNYFSPDEVRATQYLYRIAQPGSVLVGAIDDFPFPYKNYERYTYLALADFTTRERRLAIRRPALVIRQQMGSSARHAYFLITRSQVATVDETGLMPAGSLAAIGRKLSSSPGVRVVFANRDATLFAFSKGTP